MYNVWAIDWHDIMGYKDKTNFKNSGYKYIVNKTLITLHVYDDYNSMSCTCEIFTSFLN